MVVKSLDDIVLEDEIKERIRPLFEQATASGTVSFEHDWQWNAYCDLLYAAADFTERTREGTSVLVHEFSDPVELGVETYFADVQELCTGLASRCFVDSVKKLKTYSAHRSAFFKKVFHGIGISPIFLKIFKRTKEIGYYYEKVTPVLSEVKTYIEDVLDYSVYFNDFILEREGEFLDCAWYSISYDRNVMNNIYKEYISRLKNLVEPLKEVRTGLLKQGTGTEEQIDDLLFNFCVYEMNSSNLNHITPLAGVDSVDSKKFPWSVISGLVVSKNLDINIPSYNDFERIGEGSGRIAYKAWDEKDACAVTIKIAKNRDMFDSSNKRAQEEKYGNAGLAKKEGTNARKLTHKNIARYFGRGILPDGRPYTIEEYVEGITLREVIDHGGPFVGVLTRREALASMAASPSERLLQEKHVQEGILFTIIYQIIAGLAYMHQQGYVHRDMKPENILITYGTVIGDQRVFPDVKITDFELLKEIAAGDAVPHLFGSRIYQAPEVLKEGKVLPEADIFSIGIVLYEIFAQEHPFVFGEEQSITEITDCIKDKKRYAEVYRKIKENERIPATYKAMITTCLQYNPKSRYKDAEILLENFSSSKTLVWKRVNIKQYASIGAVAVALALCTGICAGTTWYVHDALTDTIDKQIQTETK